MSKNFTRVEGIYFNTSPDPVFFNDTLIGGHEHVHIDGYVRLPGHFVKMDDPQDDPNASESYRAAYAALSAKAEQSKQVVSPNSPSRRVNVTPEEVGKPEEGEKNVASKEVEKKPSRSARKGKRDSSSDDADNQ